MAFIGDGGSLVESVWFVLDSSFWMAGGDSSVFFSWRGKP